VCARRVALACPWSRNTTSRPTRQQVTQGQQQLCERSRERMPYHRSDRGRRSPTGWMPCGRVSVQPCCDVGITSGAFGAAIRVALCATCCWASKVVRRAKSVQLWPLGIMHSVLVGTSFTGPTGLPARVLPLSEPGLMQWVHGRAAGETLQVEHVQASVW
jgi:hypothetical protein